MVVDSHLLFSIPQPWDHALSWALQRLADAGMQAVRTFDFQAARPAHPGIICPICRSDTCSCQMLILFVYPSRKTTHSSSPASLIIQGQGETTSFSIVDNPQQRLDSHMDAAIRKTLALDPA
jgi:hypothetical protein